MSSKLVKCAHCDLVMWLEQRSVRYKNEWFHFDCFGKNLESKKKPIVKTITAKEKPVLQTKKPTTRTYSAVQKPATKTPTPTYKTKIISESIYSAKSLPAKPVFKAQSYFQIS